MQGEGKFIFKSIEARDGGKFTNDKGQVVSYPLCYILKLDESTDKGIRDVKLKIAETEKNLINTFKSYEPYQKISLRYDIEFNGNVVKIIPTNVTKI